MNINIYLKWLEAAMCDIPPSVLVREDASLSPHWTGCSLFPIREMHRALTIKRRRTKMIWRNVTVSRHVEDLGCVHAAKDFSYPGIAMCTRPNGVIRLYGMISVSPSQRERTLWIYKKGGSRMDNVPADKTRNGNDLTCFRLILFKNNSTD